MSGTLVMASCCSPAHGWVVSALDWKKCEDLELLLLLPLHPSVFCKLLVDLSLQDSIINSLYFDNVTCKKKKLVFVLFSGVTAIEPVWLPLYAARQCTFSKPLEEPAPTYKDGQVYCHMAATFGEYISFASCHCIAISWIFLECMYYSTCR